MIGASLKLARGKFTLDVSFEAGGAVTGVFGPSGAGKSTLIALIAGLTRPDKGRVVLDDRVLEDTDAGVRVPAHQRRVGVVFQEHWLFPHMSVGANLRYGVPRGSEAEVGRIVELLELGALQSRGVREISGGERQRVALGRALASRPRLLLLDEPLASLDARLKGQIIPYLRRVRDEAGVPMLYVSHDLGEVLQLTDRLMVMERGRLIGHGRYADLAHDGAVLGVVHDRGMTNVLGAVVVRHEAAEGVSVVRLEGADETRDRWLVPLCGAAAGARVSIQVRPWDIALAAQRVEAVSIQNQIRGIVGRCTLHERSAMVCVDVGGASGTPLTVEVSRRSATELRLGPGREVMCLIKSQAIVTT